MGAISQLLGAGLKKTAKTVSKEGDKLRYEDGKTIKQVAEESAKSADKSIAHVQSKLKAATSTADKAKYTKELARLLSVKADHLKKAATEKAAPSRKDRFGGKQPTNIKEYQEGIKKRAAEYEKTGKAPRKKKYEQEPKDKMIQSGADKMKRSKKSKETTEELLKKADKLPMLKKQAD